MNPEVRAVLDLLEARSAREQDRLEVLRSQGGSSIRDVASTLMLDVGADVGLLLNLLVRLSGARCIVEIGGSVGYSTLWLAEAARVTGGRVISFETDPIKFEQLRTNLAAAELLAQVELRPDDAGEALPQLAAPIDLLFLDHWKELYVREFQSGWPKLPRGGMVLADNVLRPAKNAQQIAAYHDCIAATPDARSLTLDIGDGVELTVKC